MKRSWIIGSLVSLAITLAAPIFAYAASYHYAISDGPFNWNFGFSSNSPVYNGSNTMYDFQDSSGDSVHIWGTQSGLYEQTDVFYWIDDTLSPTEVIGNYTSSNNFGVFWWYTDHNGTYYLGDYTGYGSYPADSDPFKGSVYLAYDCLGYY